MTGTIITNKPCISINPEICKNCNCCWALHKEKSPKLYHNTYLECYEYNDINNINNILVSINLIQSYNKKKIYNAEKILLKNSTLLKQTNTIVSYIKYFKLCTINKKIINVCKNLYIYPNNCYHGCPYFMEHQIYNWNKK